MKPFTLLLLFSLFTFPCLGETPFRVMFYNVENLFDTKDSPDTQDEEFTPEGSKYWTKSRYYRKVNAIAKTITATDERTVPSLVGLCEVESDSVLIHLTRWSPLRKYDYRFVIADTGDARGIRTALLYQRDRFKYLAHHSIRVALPGGKKGTRDILHVEGLVSLRDTLDVFVCHYPSRRGGERETEADRREASRVLREKSDSLFALRGNPLILIMGDFNDNPPPSSPPSPLPPKEGEPIDGNNIGKSNPCQLYNLFTALPPWEGAGREVGRVEKREVTGSYKFRGEWFLFDQIIVSGGLLDRAERFSLFSPDFLLMPDTQEGGLRPYSTYWGYKYQGGISDHLPVLADFSAF